MEINKKAQQSTIATAESNFPAILNDDPYRQIHPALDFKDDSAYIGIALPARSIRGIRTLRAYSVTETEIFEMTPEELERRRIELLYTDLPNESSRWSNEGIKRFLKDKDCVSPEQLFQSVREMFTEYIDFQDLRYYDLLTLWNIGTYFFPLFGAYPYLHVNGLTDSGKTQLLIVCRNIAFNAELSGSVSPAALFRKIQGTRCTLFIDENENLGDPRANQEFKTLLLNGYKRGLSVIRCDMTSTSFSPKSYAVYSPKVLSSIAPLDNVLGSRCLTILMQPTSKKEILEKTVNHDSPHGQEIRDMLYPFLFRNWRKVQQSYEELKNEAGLANRDWEIWRPILALARIFDGTIYKEMMQFAIEKAKDRKSEQGFTPEAEIAQTLLTIVSRDDVYRLKLIKEYIEEEYRYKAPNWLTEKYIGSVLRKFGFPKPERDSRGFKYYLTISKVKDIAKRLGIDDEHSEHSVGPTEG